MERSSRNFQPFSSKRKFQAIFSSPNRYVTENSRWVPQLHLSRCRLSSCVFVQKTHRTKKRTNPPIRMQKSLYFPVKGPKLILCDVKKIVVAVVEQKRLVRVVYGFTTPLRRQEMMIEILNSSSLIENLSWQSLLYVLEAK